ncbi:MAG TPA: DUF1801 domain-containing protein, partial [Candidatus Dormibacteraeota bacterium]
PAEAALQRVRQVILGADPRMTEYVKYDTVQFAFGGDMANFVQTSKKTVSLMFHRGGRIEGTFPHMEGTGRQVRFMRFADVEEVDAHADELAAAVRAWCAFAERA